MDAWGERRRDKERDIMEVEAKRRERKADTNRRKK